MIEEYGFNEKPMHFIMSLILVECLDAHRTTFCIAIILWPMEKMPLVLKID